MRCPECNALNEERASACSTCGLLLFKAVSEPVQKRRADDFAGRKRRTADLEASLCRFCGGDIPAKAIRCRHCSEIVNDDFFRERARLLRSRINYASWVAYLFGLGALLLFRPVGVLSIAAGLLLSIVYYAIPAEPPAAKGAPKSGLGALLKRQLRMERVSIPLPAFRSLKLVFVGTPLIAALVGYSANLLILQEPVNDILKENSAFSGMSVSAHYQYYVIPGVVVYDLQGLSVRQTPIDVQTAFLEFAKKMKAKKLERVELSYQGMTRFSIDGESFNKLGREYEKQNFQYVLYKFAGLFRPENGAKVNTAPNERDALVDFHRQWYGRDPLTSTINNGL